MKLWYLWITNYLHQPPATSQLYLIAEFRLYFFRCQTYCFYRAQVGEEERNLLKDILQEEVRKQVGREWTEEYVKEYEDKVSKVTEEVLQERRQQEEAGGRRTKESHDCTPKEFLKAWKEKQEKEREDTRIELDKTWGWMRLEARETTEEGLEEVGGLWPGRKKKRLGWSERASPGSEEDQVDS